MSLPIKRNMEPATESGAPIELRDLARLELKRRQGEYSRRMNNNMRTEVPCSKVELIVYLVVSPKSGRGWRTYSDEDVHALGGIHRIERALESETY